MTLNLKNIAALWCMGLSIGSGFNGDFQHALIFSVDALALSTAAKLDEISDNCPKRKK